MKYVHAILLLFAFSAAALGQETRIGTVKGSVRLFADKDDMASVITLIPGGSEVEIVQQDSLYTLVRFGNDQGFVASDRIENIQTVVTTPTANDTLNDVSPAEQGAVYQQLQVNDTVPVSRYDQLVNKYGEQVGKQIYQHKVWKGISAEMARDSWGQPKKINRMFVDQGTEEEWIYSKKWLYFKNGVLTDWGPVK